MSSLLIAHRREHFTFIYRECVFQCRRFRYVATGHHFNRWKREFNQSSAESDKAIGEVVE